LKIQNGGKRSSSTGATREGNGIGEKVSGDQTWKMRQIGDVLYLAPKEAHEGTKDDVEAANKKRVETFLDKVAANMVAQSTKVPPPTYEELRPFLSENLDAILTLVTRDGVIATDVHGYVDNDFDNPGPRLNKETQFITRGHHSLMNRDKDPVFERLGKQLARTLVPLGKDKDDTGKGDDEEPGYESGGSEVSQDRCRESPAYPMCEDNCWLSKRLRFQALYPSLVISRRRSRLWSPLTYTLSSSPASLASLSSNQERAMNKSDARWSLWRSWASESRTKALQSKDACMKPCRIPGATRPNAGPSSATASILA
jgi:hypothetical protein